MIVVFVAGETVHRRLMYPKFDFAPREPQLLRHISKSCLEQKRRTSAPVGL